MKHYLDYVYYKTGNTTLASAGGASVAVYAAGTTNLSTIYSDDGITVAANPLTTNANGMFHFWAPDGRYKIVSTYNGVSVTEDDVEIADVIEQHAADANWNIKSLSVNGLNAGQAVVTSSLKALASVPIRYADQFAGVDAGAKIIAAINDIPVTGGIVDARGMEGAQAITTNMFSGVTKPVLILLGDATFTISSAQLIPSNVTIEGAGTGRTIFKTAASSAASFYPFKNSDTTSGNTNIKLRNFTIDGNKASQTNTGQGGILFSKVSNSTLSYLEVKNVKGNAASGIQWATAIDNSANADNLLEFLYLHDNGDATNNADGLAIGGVRVRIVEGSYQANSDSGIGLQGAGTNGIEIVGGLFKDNTLTGIAAGPGANTNITISHPTISGTNSYGIYFSGVTKFAISSPLVSIVPGAGFSDGILLENVQDGAVINPVISQTSNMGLAVVTNSGTVKNIVIQGGVIRNAKQNGIRIETVVSGDILQDVSVLGTIIKNNSQGTVNTWDGIRIGQVAGATTKSININGVITGDDQVVPTQRYGIAVGGSPSLLTIVGNTVIGNATGAYSGIPTETHLVGNNAGASASGAADSLTVGDGVNMPNSSTRTANIWGRDVSGSFRQLSIFNDGSNFWFGNFNQTGGYKYDAVNGGLTLQAAGSNQSIVLNPVGTGIVDVTGAMRTAVNVFTSSVGTATANLALSNIQQHILTENTTLSLSNIKSGLCITFIIIQHASAAKTFTWPATVHGGMTVSPTLSSVNVQKFVVSNAGTDLYASGPGVVTT